MAPTDPAQVGRVDQPAHGFVNDGKHAAHARVIQQRLIVLDEKKIELEITMLRRSSGTSAWSSRCAAPSAEGRLPLRFSGNSGFCEKRRRLRPPHPQTRLVERAHQQFDVRSIEPTTGDPTRGTEGEFSESWSIRPVAPAAEPPQRPPITRARFRSDNSSWMLPAVSIARGCSGQFRGTSRRSIRRLHRARTCHLILFTRSVLLRVGRCLEQHHPDTNAQGDFERFPSHTCGNRAVLAARMQGSGRGQRARGGAGVGNRVVVHACLRHG